MAARALRDELLARRGRGDVVPRDSRLRFGDAAERWLNGPVLDLRPSTQAGYRNAVDQHLGPRYGSRKLNGITAEDLASLVREMRGRGKSEATIPRRARRHGPDLQVRNATPRLDRNKPDNPDALVGAAEGLIGETPADLHR